MLMLYWEMASKMLAMDPTWAGKPTKVTKVMLSTVLITVLALIFFFLSVEPALFRRNQMGHIVKPRPPACHKDCGVNRASGKELLGLG